jgi:hypothetical protein
MTLSISLLILQSAKVPFIYHIFTDFLGLITHGNTTFSTRYFHRKIFSFIFTSSQNPGPLV